ncbi:Ig-like domain-containing protein [Microbacterium sp. NPDC055683]
MRRRFAVLALAAVLVSAAAATPVAAYTGPNAVAVPYLDEKAVSLPQGWTITDCAPITAASPLVVACAADGFLLRADSYDPDYGQDVVPVPMTNGRTTTTMEYVVTLEAPEQPTVADLSYAHPVAAGGAMLLPLSDLDAACLVCGGGARLEVFSVSPSAAAEVTATETHLIVRPRASFDGPLEVTIRVADEFGTWSEPATIAIPVYRADSAPVAQAVRLPLPTDTTAIDLAALVQTTVDGPVSLVGCGEALHGVVACGADGTARYTPRPGVSADQFSFHVAQGGAQATGSVTFVGSDTGIPDDGPAATQPVEPAERVPRAELEAAQQAERDKEAEAAEAAGEEPPADDEDVALIGLRVPLVLQPRTPVEQTGQAVGAFDALRSLLDRVGAR